jgi:3-methyladenine DNA glycosylase/8-oxoguanine DNA glycosylase
MARARAKLEPFDVDRTFGVHRFGAYDPTVVRRPRGIEKAFVWSGSPHTLRVTAAGGAIEIEATGPDAEGVLADFTSALETSDGYETFAPDEVLLSRLHREQPGMRLVRVPWRFELAACAVLQQRVTTREAMQQWRHVAQRYGEDAMGLRAFPGIERVAQMESWRFEELGVDPKRARTLTVLAREALRRKTFDQLDLGLVRKQLLAVRGVGPWTSEMTMGFAYGDPDALPLGDLHLPHLVSWALERKPRSTDERMVQLLEPFRGHRFRVTRLLLASGISVPRR